MAGVSLLRNELEAFVSSANDALNLKLVRCEEDLENPETSFHPEFTHQVFGENESIFGYKDLEIQLYYTAGNLDAYLNIKYKKKVDSAKYDGVEADNVSKSVSEKLPPGFTSNIDMFVAKLKKEDRFKPFGEKLHEVTISWDGTDRHFIICLAEITVPGFKDYHERLQPFILWFIDAGSYIDLDDDRWRFFLIYEKYVVDKQPVYATVGFTSVYHYYAYPDKIRPRISQMLILPPFQKKGLGAIVLNTIYSYYYKDSQVLNITVEDPSDDFIRLRDFVDAKNCLKLNSFESKKLLQGFSNEMVEEAQQKLKLGKKQLRRVYEILRLKATDLSNKEQYRLYRLDVKKRLNLPYQKQQADLEKLKKQLDPEELKAASNIPSKAERIKQLEHDYEELENEYKKTLERLATSDLP